MSRPQWWQYNSKARKVYTAVRNAGDGGITHADLVAECSLVGREVSNMLAMLTDGGFVCYRGGCFWTVDNTCSPLPGGDPAPIPAPAPAPASEAAPAVVTSTTATPTARAAPTASFDLTVDGRFAITWAGGCLTLPKDVTRDMFRHLDRLGGLVLEEALDDRLGSRP